MNYNNLLYAKQDLGTYKKGDVEKLAQHLKITSENYDDMLWLTTLQLHGQNTQKAQMPRMSSLIDIPLNDIDVWMARFAWMANQTRKMLSKDLVTRIETLLEEYRVYVQGGEENPSEMRNKIELYISFVAGTEQYKQPMQIYADPRQTVQVSTMSGKLSLQDDEDLVNESKKTTPVHKMVVDTTLDQRNRKAIRGQLQQQLRQMPSGEEKAQARHELLGSDGHLKPESLTQIYSIMRAQQDQFLGSLAQNMIEMQEAGTGVDALNMGIDERLVRVEKATIEMSQQIRDLHTAQIQKQGLTEVAWYNLPKKIKLAFCQGFKRGIITVAAAPITLPAAIVSNIVIKPMTETFEFFSRWIRLAWGAIMWVVVIAGVAYIYYEYDWSYVNQIVQSRLGEGAYNYLTWGVRTGWELVPPVEGLVRAMGQLWKDVGETVVGTIVENIQNFGVYMYAAIFTAFCTLLITWADSVWSLGYIARQVCTQDTEQTWFESIWNK